MAASPLFDLAFTLVIAGTLYLVIWRLWFNGAEEEDDDVQGAR